MKHQRTIIRIILGLALICAFIYPALGSNLSLGVNVIPGDTQIVSTDPSETFEIDADDAQTLTITLDRNVTAVWYENGTEIRTDYNVTTSAYYFTSSTAGTFNLSVFCTDSFTGLSQVNFTWNVTVSSVTPYPTPPRANRPIFPYVAPTEPSEEDIYEEEVDYPEEWGFPEEFKLTDNIVMWLGIGFLVLLLYTMKRNGGGNNPPGRRGPVKF